MRTRLEPAAPGARVTRLELFYDLVFVYAFLNVTTVTSEALTPSDLAKGLLVLVLLWFAWITFAALGNFVRADQGFMPLIGFATMAAIVGLAVTVPEAFANRPGGLPGDLIFASCYFVVRALQVVGLGFAATGLSRLRRPLLLQAPPVLISTCLLFVAATLPHRFLSGRAEFAARAGIWLLAIAVEYTASALIRVQDIMIVSVEHWADRYAQIILIAFGESILSVGIGPNLVTGLPVSWPVLLGIALSIAIIAALWWTYFDSLAPAAEEALRRTPGDALGTRSRDAYMYLHLPMIVGIILLSLGLKRVLADLANPGSPSTGDTLAGVERFVLAGGITVYLLALTGFQWRMIGRPDRITPWAIALTVAQIPIARLVPELIALALLTLVTTAQVTVWAIRTRGRRRTFQQRRLDEQRALEAGEIEWRRRHM
ncbi:low temperature requirement protein A [Phytohabitans suffuscus]|uniref:Low temperature requirement protein A n=1 Tax=Phytohabitans suffuscus TaxID=624315 RepID=A0A6F8YFF6_9ACTN|nr:low temperature requirement protein A [Phytohabitans suffuscus]BCB84800.1 low temperature requirement protein A [Phytohabitans suffuscus]